MWKKSPRPRTGPSGRCAGPWNGSSTCCKSRRRATIASLELKAMPPVDWERLLDDFDAAWRTGTPPRIDDILPAGGNRRELLEELIKIDLECRWRTRPTGGSPWAL